MEAVKFTFETNFEGAADSQRAKERARKSYSTEEVEEIKAKAREEGRKDGDVRAMQAMAAAVGQVAAAMHAAIEAMDGELEAIRGDAAGLAFISAKKLANAALSSAPEAEILEALKNALHQAIGEPRVVVRTTPTLAHRLDIEAAAIAHHEGYEGRVQFLADPALSGADCRIEWRGGGIERAHGAIETAISDLIARRFAPMKE